MATHDVEGVLKGSRKQGHEFIGLMVIFPGGEVSETRMAIIRRGLISPRQKVMIARNYRSVTGSYETEKRPKLVVKNSQ